MGLGDDFVAALASLSSDSSVVMLAILAVFALAHSGLAFLRPYGALRGLGGGCLGWAGLDWTPACLRVGCLWFWWCWV